MMAEKRTSTDAGFLNGIWTENPLLRLSLGICPALAVTTTAANGLGMGIATACVLVCTSLVAALLGKIVSEKGRLAVLMLVSACFATVAGMVLEGWFNELYKALGVFVPLIAVNSLILNRSDRVAAQTGIVTALADAIGMGFGYIAAMTLIGVVRELFGSGTLFGAKVMGEAFKPMTMLVKPAGGFLVTGILMGIFAIVCPKHQRKEGESA